MTVSPLESVSRFTKIFSHDPFRIFFPLGVLTGIVGVGEWALWTVGWWPLEAVSSMHALLQTQGFLAFFVVGFLLTAFPRFSGTVFAQPYETIAALLGAMLFLAGVGMRFWRLAHAGFLGMLLVVIFFAARRVRRSTKPIPPSFPLLGFGLIHAIVGATILAVTEMGEKNFELFVVGRRLVQQGFILCMVLGVTAKLAPFLMGYTADPRLEAAGSMPRVSRWLVPVHLTVGILLFASFWLETSWPRPASILRAVVVTAHLLTFARMGRLPQKKTVTILFFWISCWMVPVGLWLSALFPLYRIPGLHLAFIGGFSLMIFSFGLLVIFTHTGRAMLLNGSLRPLKFVGVAVMAAALLRYSADFFPSQYIRFLHFGSGCWVLAAVVWLVYVLAVRVPTAAAVSVHQ